MSRFFRSKIFFHRKENRTILVLAVPAALSKLTVPLMGLIDTGFTGNFLSEADLAGIALGSVVFSIVLWSFTFLEMGVSGTSAVAWGAGEKEEADAILARGMLMAGAAGLLLILFGDWLLRVAFFWFEAETSAESSAEVYLRVRLLSAPALLGLFVLFGWFLGLGKPILSAWVLLLVAVVNFILDYVFIVVLTFGIEGIAWATVAAQYAGFFTACLFIGKMRPGFWSRLKSLAVFEKKKWLEFVKINGDIFIRTALLTLSITIFMNLSAEQGNDILAVNSIFIQVWTFCAYLLDGFALSAENLVGRCIGMKRNDLFRVYKRLLFFWSNLTAFLLTLVLLVAGSDVVDALARFDSVREISGYYMIWLWLCPLVGNYSFLWDGIFIGTTDSVSMKRAMIYCFVLFMSGVLFYRVFFSNNHFLWLILILFTLSRGGMLEYFARKRERVWFGF